MEIDEFLIHSTIRIEAYLPNNIISTGTGFFFTFFEDDPYKVPTIITNKHVIEGANKILLRFSIQESGKFIEKEIFTFELNGFATIPHPDPEVDLCLIPIAELHNKFNAPNRNLYYTTLTKKEIIRDDYMFENISNIEDITVVGYPDGIWDDVNNLPIVRQGITATSLKYDFSGKAEFLIDSAIFGGSSGSPVFIFNQGSYSIKNNLYAGGRLMLVGIVYAVALHTVNGKVKIVQAPTSQKQIVSETNIPNNLGVVIKARKILDFESILKKMLAKND